MTRTHRYTLTNAEDQTRRRPDTFEIPDGIDRHALMPGQVVKLIFDDAERMWVVIDEQVPGGYVGRLVSDPAFVPMRWGDEVCFGPEHVIEINSATGIDTPCVSH